MSDNTASRRGVQPLPRAIIAALCAAALGFGLAEIGETAYGRSAIDASGLTLVPAVSVGVGVLVALIDVRTSFGHALLATAMPISVLIAMIAATAYCFGGLVSAGIHDHLNLLPFAVVFVGIWAGLPFLGGFLAATGVGRRLRSRTTTR